MQSKIAVLIQSPEGKLAKPSMLATMPVGKLLDICKAKFELGEGEYQLMMQQRALDPEATLEEAGVREGAKLIIAPLPPPPPPTVEPSEAMPRAMSQAQEMIRLVIEDPAGNRGKPAMPPSTPLWELVESCRERFQLGEGDYQLLLKGRSLDPALTLAEAGVGEGDRLQLALAHEPAHRLPTELKPEPLMRPPSYAEVTAQKVEAATLRRRSGPDPAGYQEGSRVAHKLFGPGIVVAREPKGKLWKLTIRFEGSAGSRDILSCFVEPLE